MLRARVRGGYRWRVKRFFVFAEQVVIASARPVIVLPAPHELQPCLLGHDGEFLRLRIERDRTAARMIMG